MKEMTAYAKRVKKIKEKAVEDFIAESLFAIIARYRHDKDKKDIHLPLHYSEYIIRRIPRSLDLQDIKFCGHKIIFQ
jgi:hypothetical protein